MKLTGIPFEIQDLSQLPPTRHAGERGFALWRTREVGNVRVRLVEYSAGYLADHWCKRGHVLHVLEGDLLTELADGRSFKLGAGQTYLVADDDGAHRSSTASGVRLFIVD
ncbi:MAG: DHCW motif cupin fold protein [Deltaproteobacteria bacterium]|nr:DHCW motif cupin fold protein [Deltaproteobacteria bacterium]